MILSIASALLLLSAGHGLAAPSTDDCRYTAERDATVDAAGADLLRLSAAAGSLRVVGVPGLQEIRVRGEACASRRERLDEIRLVADRSGDEVRVQVEMPDRSGSWWRGNDEMRLDLVLEIPEDMALDVDDSSGDTEIQNVAALSIDDSSGGLDLRDIGGELRVRDSSGEIRIDGVRGDVRLHDSSGGIEVRDVRGSVTVERDSSGGIRITEVTGDVLILRDSSGGIAVASVGGDFVVERDGSGGISYRDVEGGVDIPDDKRHGRRN